MSDPPRARRRGSRAAEVLGHASRTGADEALRSLISQFADPYSFLRELVQNSLDAASTQIDVEIAYDDAEQLTTITVADNGEGMNERIIDAHLLTLFSSAKEGDLTKIGKFGIGFVSIFAIEPLLVVLETGQAGESWRLIFHADARFEKLRLDQPVEGTTIRLFKASDAAAFGRIEQRARDVVRYWCKFAEAEITVNGEPVRQAFALPDALSIDHREPGTELVVGLRAAPLPPPQDWQPRSTAEQLTPLIGFYNRGLTLVEGASLPGGEAELAGISFRIKSRYLEHTLTRDNVLQDESYAKAMALLRRQVDVALRPALVRHMGALAQHLSGGAGGPDPGPPSYYGCLVFASLPAIALAQHAVDAPLLPTTDGAPISLARLRRVRSPLGAALAAERPNPLTRALGAAGIPVLLAQPGLQPFLRAMADVQIVSANESLFTAEPVELDAVTADLLRACLELVRTLGLLVKALHLGELDYDDCPVANALYQRQKEAFGVTKVGERATLLGGARQVVLNRSHPLVAACIELAAADLPLAALLLAQAINAEEGGEATDAAGLAERSLAMPAPARVATEDGSR